MCILSLLRRHGKPPIELLVEASKLRIDLLQRRPALQTDLLDQTVQVYAMAALHTPFGLRRRRRDQLDAQTTTGVPEGRQRPLPSQLLFHRRLALREVDALAIHVQAARNPIALDPPPEKLPRGDIFTESPHALSSDLDSLRSVEVFSVYVTLKQEEGQAEPTAKRHFGALEQASPRSGPSGRLTLAPPAHHEKREALLTLASVAWQAPLVSTVATKRKCLR